MWHTGRRWIAALLLVAAGLFQLCSVRAAHAVAACDADDIIAGDPGCGPTGLCQVTRSFEMTRNGCIFDFGGRGVLFNSGGRLVSGRFMVTIKAGAVGFAGGGEIDGSGTQAPPNNVGGVVRIDAAGAVAIQGAQSGIDVSGDNNAGAIIINAGGSVNVDGRLIANGTLRLASGGTIAIRAGDDFISTADSTIEAIGAREAGTGGTFDLLTGDRVDLGSRVDISGSEGGVLEVFSRGEMILRELRGAGTGDAGSGGCMTAVAGTRLEARDLIDFDGMGSSQGSGGGCGGFVCLEAQYGDLLVTDAVRAQGATPDGGGGSIALIATGSVNLLSSATVAVRGNGAQGCGGEICLDSDGGVDSQAFLDASGGSAGGDADLTSRKNLSIRGGIDVRGRTVGGFAGNVLLEAGSGGAGALSITAPIQIGAGGCSPELGCGVGGLAQLVGCNVELAPSGNVNGRAPEGGSVEFIAREQLTIRGAVDVTTTGGTESSDGAALLSHPSRKAPTIAANQVKPAPTITALGTCTMPRQDDCVIPCPTCGNGVVEFPEECDNSNSTPVSCDGCDTACRLEDCDDMLTCTVDSCTQALGCRHVPALPVGTPCFEPGDASPTPTPTQTPTQRRATPSPTLTRTVSPTPPITPAGPSATATATQMSTPTATEVITATEAPSSTPTSNASDCVGDCSGNSDVTVDELVRGVNILLETMPLSLCPAFDANNDGQVLVNELVEAVNNVLNGCDA